MTGIIIHTRAGPVNNRNLIFEAQTKFLYSFETVDTIYLVHYDITVTERLSTGHSHFSKLACFWGFVENIFNKGTQRVIDMH